MQTNDRHCSQEWLALNMILRRRRRRIHDENENNSWRRNDYKRVICKRKGNGGKSFRLIIIIVTNPWAMRTDCGVEETATSNSEETSSTSCSLAIILFHHCWSSSTSVRLGCKKQIPMNRFIDAFVSICSWNRTGERRRKRALEVGWLIWSDRMIVM